MDKTSEKVTKDPKRQERGKKSHETYMKWVKEKILEYDQLPTLSHRICLRLLPLPLQVTLCLLPVPMPQDPVILMSMALVYLLSLPLTFVYFLYITLLRLKIKNSSIKNRITHQHDAICVRKNMQ